MKAGGRERRGRGHRDDRTADRSRTSLVGCPWNHHSPRRLVPRAPRAVVFAGACPDCRIGGVAVEPGVPLALGRSVSVPRGARLTLGFALPGALLDPTSGADLEGPAAASAADDHTISLERGSARFRGLHDITLSVRAPASSAKARRSR